MKFQKGQSGNPKGRPKGSKSWTTKQREKLNKYVPEIVEAMIAQATSGDTTAAKILLDRCLPVLKTESRPVTIELKGTLTEQAEQITRAMANGTLTPDEGNALLAGLQSRAKLDEISDLTKRIEALEKDRGTST